MVKSNKIDLLNSYIALKTKSPKFNDNTEFYIINFLEIIDLNSNYMIEWIKKQTPTSS